MYGTNKNIKKRYDKLQINWPELMDYRNIMDLNSPESYA